MTDSRYPRAVNRIEAVLAAHDQPVIPSDSEGSRARKALNRTVASSAYMLGIPRRRLLGMTDESLAGGHEPRPYIPEGTLRCTD
jgi:hypothetical protein